MQSLRHMTCGEIAAMYGITLPADPAQLPTSYTMRMYVMRKVAMLRGLHRLQWQKTKSDPDLLAIARARNKAGVKRYRLRQNHIKPVQASPSTTQHTLQICPASCQRPHH